VYKKWLQWRPTLWGAPCRLGRSTLAQVLGVSGLPVFAKTPQRIGKQLKNAPRRRLDCRPMRLSKVARLLKETG
jgi:hypothetical protein